ncbi:FliH/SctL family protein [Sphingomonas sp. LY54]|uniref:FliH/SctL family protein n=1 Tax=Sphingomonas sp. LY54 TaxID=3095343 RepID=UPI002D7704B2|nr:FliH/SctL family protein [Sphingomonas sp. LY54]WRP28314.1 FliH/SctL family protein [Sphingomonas sp. LY54]
MSDFRMADAVESACWIGTFAGSGRVATFTPWASQRPGMAPIEGEDDGPTAVIDPAAIRAEAFAQGFDEGRRTVTLECADERAAIARLAEALEVLRPEPTNALAALLAETVDRLVRQVVGEVAIDPQLLIARAEAAAALIGEELEPSKLLVHPDDAPLLADARIPVEIVADPSLERGAIVLQAAAGWVEDGPAVRLDRLRAALAKLGAPE